MGDEVRTQWRRDIICGDALTELRKMGANQFDCVMTSPPYCWALRDYGVTGQLGLEPTWQEHLDALLPIFGEVHRILKPTGSLWANYGDTVVQNPHGSRPGDKRVKGEDRRRYMGRDFGTRHQPSHATAGARGNGPRKHKIGLAWRLRFRLNDEQGWISRSDVVWHKPNQMPLSMKDRLTPKHEDLFHLVKKPRYYFDLDAIRVPFAGADRDSWEARRLRGAVKGPSPGRRGDSHQRSKPFNILGRDAMNGRLKGKLGSLRTASQSDIDAQHRLRAGYTGLQGDSPRAWTEDGAFPNNTTAAQQAFNVRAKSEANGTNIEKWSPHQRRVRTAQPPVVDREDGRPAAGAGRGPPEPGDEGATHPLGANPGDVWSIPSRPFGGAHFATYPEDLVRLVLLSSCPLRVCAACGKPWVRTLKPTCKCPGALKAWRPGLVLDPFFGAGTTGKVAAELGLDFVGIELNPKYIKIARRRLGHLLNPLPHFDKPNADALPAVTP